MIIDMQIRDRTELPLFTKNTLPSEEYRDMRREDIHPRPERRRHIAFFTSVTTIVPSARVDFA